MDGPRAKHMGLRARSRIGLFYVASAPASNRCPSLERRDAHSLKACRHTSIATNCCVRQYRSVSGAYFCPSGIIRSASTWQFLVYARDRSLSRFVLVASVAASPNHVVPYTRSGFRLRACATVGISSTTESAVDGSTFLRGSPWCISEEVASSRDGRRLVRITSQYHAASRNCVQTASDPSYSSRAT